MRRYFDSLVDMDGSVKSLLEISRNNSQKVIHFFDMLEGTREPERSELSEYRTLTVLEAIYLLSGLHPITNEEYINFYLKNEIENDSEINILDLKEYPEKIARWHTAEVTGFIKADQSLSHTSGIMRQDGLNVELIQAMATDYFSNTHDWYKENGESTLGHLKLVILVNTDLCQRLNNVSKLFRIWQRGNHPELVSLEYVINWAYKIDHKVTHLAEELDGPVTNQRQNLTTHKLNTKLREYIESQGKYPTKMEFWEWVREHQTKDSFVCTENPEIMWIGGKEIDFDNFRNRSPAKGLAN